MHREDAANDGGNGSAEWPLGKLFGQERVGRFILVRYICLYTRGVTVGFSRGIDFAQVSERPGFQANSFPFRG